MDLFTFYIGNNLLYCLDNFYTNDIKLYIGNSNDINPVSIITIVISTKFASFRLTMFNQDKNIIYARPSL